MRRARAVNKYDRTIRQALLDYEVGLSDRELTLLTLLSAFRTSAPKAALQVMLRTTADEIPLDPTLANLSAAEIGATMEELSRIGWLWYDSTSESYAIHPLIRAHFLARRVVKAPEQLRAIHERIQHYYLSVSKDLPFRPSVKDLKPLAEALHHACRAARYAEGYNIFVECIYQGKRRVLVNELGAWEAALAMLSEFFPDGDTSREQQLQDREAKVWALNETRACSQRPRAF